MEQLAEALSLIASLLLFGVYMVITGLLTLFAYKKNSGILYIIAAAALTFTAILLLTLFHDLYSLAFAIIIGGTSAFVGYSAWEFYTKRAGSE